MKSLRFDMQYDLSCSWPLLGNLNCAVSSFVMVQSSAICLSTPQERERI